MSAREHDATTRTRAARRLRILLLALVTVAPMALGWAGPATAADLPVPTSITVAATTDPTLLAANNVSAQLPSLPSVLAGPGDSIRVTVNLFAGLSPAAYRSGQTVSLRADGPGSLSVPAVATMPAGASSATFIVSYSAASTAVRVTATIGKGSKSLTATSTAFRVESTLRFLQGQAAGLKNGSVGSDGAGCAVVDRANPVCARIVLPSGATGGVALSLGDCDPMDPCRKVTQLIADLGGVGYDRQHPARMILICDKVLCGKRGVSSVVPLWSQSATGAMTAVTACAAKDVIDPGLRYCVDYVSSKRDGAGDTFIHVLFLDDVRGSI